MICCGYCFLGFQRRSSCGGVGVFVKIFLELGVIFWNVYKFEMVRRENLKVREEEENGFKMNEGGWGVGWFQREIVKEGKSRFFWRFSQVLEFVFNVCVRIKVVVFFGGRLVVGVSQLLWRFVGGEIQDQLEKFMGQMFFFLFVKGVEVEIVFVFLILEFKQRFWCRESGVLFFLYVIQVNRIMFVQKQFGVVVSTLVWKKRFVFQVQCWFVVVIKNFRIFFFMF